MHSERNPPHGFGQADLVALVLSTLSDLHPGAVGLPSVELGSSLDRDLGFDSLGRMELLLRLEAAAGVALPEDTLAHAETVADLWQAVGRGRARSSASASAAPVVHAALASGPGVFPRGVSGPASGPVAPEPAGDAEAAPWTRAQTLLEVLDAHLRVHPDRVQIVYLADTTQTPITYRELAAGADVVVSTIPAEAASSVSEFGHEHETPPRALTVTGWMRAKRAIRASAIAAVWP